MKASGDTFATAFNCMDGRCQDAVAAYARAAWGVTYVDAITEPGIDGILAGKHLLPEQPTNVIEWIRRKGEISAKGHGSTHAVVVGHAKCAGNNVSDSAHAGDIARAVEIVRSWNMFEEVVGLMALQEAAGWTVTPIDHFHPQEVAAA